MGSKVLISIVLLVAVAAFSGFISGFFGIGGGIVLVPCFLYIFPHLGASTAAMHNAVATSLALLIPTALVATRSQHKLGHFDATIFKPWAIGLGVGAVVGAVIADFISSRALLVGFAGFMCFALLLQFVKKLFSDAETEQPNKKLMVVSSVIIGAVSAVLGIGGGLFSSSALRLLRYPLRRSLAIATAGAMIVGVVGATSNIITGLGEPGRAAYSLGYVNIAAFVLTTPFMMLTAPLGVRAAHNIKRKTLDIIYIIFFAIMTIIVVHKTIVSF